VPACFLLGAVTLHSSRTRIRLGDLGDSSINADPASFPATMPACFFLGAVTLHSSRMRIRLGDLGDSSINANPASSLSAVPDRFFSAWITLTISLPAIGHRHLDNLPVNAAPTEFPTVPERFFSGGVTLAALFLAFRRVDQHEVAVNATPAEIFTMPERFFARRITLTFALATFLGRCLDNLAVDAAPTLTRRSRRWRRRWAMNRRWTWKREPPARRIFRRTRWMIARRAVPPITTAAFFPPPAATFLNPGPLATLIVPLPTRHCLRRQFESVFVAVFGNPVADNHARITDGPRDSQHFEITLGKIAEHVQVVHLVFDKKKSVFRIVSGGGGADDHAGGVCAVAGDTVRGAGVATKCAQISDGERWLATDMSKSAGENGNDCKTDFGLHVHGSVVVAEKLRVSEKNSRGQAQT
jgi:hypothetical protein